MTSDVTPTTLMKQQMTLDSHDFSKTLSTSEDNSTSLVSTSSPQYSSTESTNNSSFRRSNSTNSTKPKRRVLRRAFSTESRQHSVSSKSSDSLTKAPVGVPLNSISSQPNPVSKPELETISFHTNRITPLPPTLRWKLAQTKLNERLREERKRRGAQNN